MSRVGDVDARAEDGDRGAARGEGAPVRRTCRCRARRRSPRTTPAPPSPRPISAATSQPSGDAFRAPTTRHTVGQVAQVCAAHEQRRPADRPGRAASAGTPASPVTTNRAPGRPRPTAMTAAPSSSPRTLAVVLAGAVVRAGRPQARRRPCRGGPRGRGACAASPTDRPSSTATAARFSSPLREPASARTPSARGRSSIAHPPSAAGAILDVGAGRHAVAERLRHVLGLDALGARDVGDRSRDADRAVEAAARQREAVDGGREQVGRAVGERARAGAPSRPASARCTSTACPPVASRCRARAASTRARTASDRSPVSPPISSARVRRGTNSWMSTRSSSGPDSRWRYCMIRFGRHVHRRRRSPVEPARARVRRGDEREPRGELDHAAAARDHHAAVLERLAQPLDGVAAELGELVQEQHAVVRERDLAGARQAGPAAQERRRRHGVVRHPERPGRHQAALQHAGHRVQARHLERLLAGHRGQDRREPAREHRLARAGRPDQQHVVAARRGDLQRAPRDRLPTDLRRGRHRSRSAAASAPAAAGAAPRPPRRPAARTRGGTRPPRPGTVRPRPAAPPPARPPRGSPRGTTTPSSPASAAAIATASTPGVAISSPFSDSSPQNAHRSSRVAGHLRGRGEHAQGQRQVEPRALLADVRRRQVHHHAAQRPRQAAALHRGPNPFARVLHAGARAAR